MCGACLSAAQAQTGMTELQVQQTSCDYTREELEIMLAAAQPPLSNFIQSQLNVYHQNCNFFSNEINEYLNS